MHVYIKARCQPRGSQKKCTHSLWHKSTLSRNNLQSETKLHGFAHKRYNGCLIVKMFVAICNHILSQAMILPLYSIIILPCDHSLPDTIPNKYMQTNDNYYLHWEKKMKKSYHIHKDLFTLPTQPL